MGLAEHGDFEALAARIDAAAPRPSRVKGGRPAYPTARMIKILVLQQLYSLAYDTLEYQLLDRRSFLRFLDMTESSSIPHSKTIRQFRDRLAQACLGNQVFGQVQQQLLSQGYRSVEDETETTYLLHRDAEGLDVGTVEARRFSADDSPAI
ncbi:transposase [Janthinobacterium sp. BJB304]|uniref:transposase n=1 Tax=Janthinobacterium sp. BJB304 TaxID=1572871 RepID=UPI00117B88B8|nr:transposase [Janthinobacterium sp. BJB304]